MPELSDKDFKNIYNEKKQEIVVLTQKLHALIDKNAENMNRKKLQKVARKVDLKLEEVRLFVCEELPYSQVSLLEDEAFKDAKSKIMLIDFIAGKKEKRLSLRY